MRAFFAKVRKNAPFLAKINRHSGLSTDKIHFEHFKGGQLELFVYWHPPTTQADTALMVACRS